MAQATAAQWAELGTELTVLAWHVFEKYLTAPADGNPAYRELTLRTRVPLLEEDARQIRRVGDLCQGRWHRIMKRRYQAVRRDVATRSGREAVEEARELVLSMYPSGCRDAAKELESACYTCTDMLTVVIPSAALRRETRSAVEALLSSRGGATVSLTAQEMATWLVEGPLMAALVPSRWWERDDCTSAASGGNGDDDDDGRDGGAPPTVIAVALRTSPPTLLVEYTRNTYGGGGPNGRSATLRRRCRRIHVSSASFSATNGSVTQVAKRLVQSHGTLLSEEELQRHLAKLQELLRSRGSRSSGEGASSVAQRVATMLAEAEEEEDAAVVRSGSRAAAKVVAASPAPAPGATTKAGPQKADLGLLYRDPEKALENVDLNDADDVTLQEFKAKMDETFAEKVVRPGDPGYVYDKRLDVAAPTAKSEWDETDSDD